MGVLFPFTGYGFLALRPFDMVINLHSLAFTRFYRGLDHAVFRVNTHSHDNVQGIILTKAERLIKSFTNAGNSHSSAAEIVE